MFDERVTAPFLYWIRRCATERLHAASVDDGVQEALIAVHKVLCDRPDVPREYLVGVVKRSLNQFARGGNPTGREGRHGYVDAANRSSSMPEDFDAADVVADPSAVVVARNLQDNVRAAVDSLSPRDAGLVRAKFWDDLTWEQAARKLGWRSGRAAQMHWFSYVKPQLRESLESWA